MPWRRELHGAFDELLGAFFDAHPRKYPSTTTVRELMEWSARQVLEADGDRSGSISARVAAAVDVLDGSDETDGDNQ